MSKFSEINFNSLTDAQKDGVIEQVSKELSSDVMQLKYIDNDAIGNIEVEVPEGPFIDLGLPSGTLWAKCNLGASTPQETGKYYAWGETIGYTQEQAGTDRKFRPS